jgi:hypothetical protein
VSRGTDTDSPSQIVRARRIELVDEHGDIKITLDAQAQASVMRLWGKDGRVKGSFGLLTTDQPALLLLDGYLPRVDLRLEDDGQPSFGLVYDRSMNVCEALIEAGKKQERQEKRTAKQRPAKAKKMKP